MSVGALVQVLGSKRRLRMREILFQSAAVVSLLRVQHVQLSADENHFLVKVEQPDPGPLINPLKTRFHYLY